tara:strand:- start:128980 stop:129375 length:396 start_codon:yes stop_codon:yes gene_type:complete
MSVNKILIWAVLIIGLSLTSCGQEETKPAPDNLIDKQVMTEILADISKVEARFQRRLSVRGSNNDKMLSHNYEVVFEKYGVTMDQFKSSFEYYEQSPLEMQIMFDSVLVHLTEEQAVVESIYYDSTKIEKK